MSGDKLPQADLGPHLKQVQEAVIDLTRDVTLEDAWELGWASARDTYTALYTKTEIPETVMLRNPFGHGLKYVTKAGNPGVMITITHAGETT